MKKFSILFAWLFTISLSHAQIFKDSTSITFEPIYGIKFKLADVNNDGTFDYIVLKTSADSSRIEIYNDDQFISTLLDSTLNIFDFDVADMDNNNQLDLIILSVFENDTILQVLLQSEDHAFENWSVVDTTSITQFSIGDVNKDGKRDILYTNDQNELKLKFLDRGRWEDVLPEPLNFTVNKFVHFDANNELGDELFYSDGESTRIINWDSTWTDVDSIISESTADAFAYGDVDDDGYFDLGFYHDNTYQLSLSKNEPLSIEIGQYSQVKSWLHDFNSDGITDLLFTGILDDSTAVLKLYLKNINGQLNIEEDRLFNPTLGFDVCDIDRDGDLDVFIILYQETGIILQRLDNITPDINKGPSATPEHYAFVDGRKVTLFWAEASDDFTKNKNLTYDIFIGNQEFNGEFVSPHFYLDSLSRQISAYGNAGLNTEFKLNYELPIGIGFYGIQTIDNALFAQKGSGSCTVGSFVVCDKQEIVQLNPCEGEEITIQNAEEMAYYSVNKGFLGVTNRLSYFVDGSDRITTAIQGSTNCSDYKVYEITPIDQLTVFELDEMVYCVNDEVPFQLDAPSNVDSVKWIFNDKIISTDSILSFFPQATGLLKVILFNGLCSLSDSVNLKVGNPILKIIKSTYFVNSGGMAQFEIEASNYDSIYWTPASNLNDGYSLTPVVTPTEDETYTITISDEFVCEASGTVQVIINTTSYIPDLFSPNGDGQNDRLLVYDLKYANSVKLSIYNRSGTKVFESTNIDKLSFEGWDGITNGKEQPIGLYFWKIEGDTKSNGVLKANGKSEGVIYLMR